MSVRRKASSKLELQLQAFAARDMARRFLGHLGNTIATLKFFFLRFTFQTLKFISF